MQAQPGPVHSIVINDKIFKVPRAIRDKPNGNIKGYILSKLPTKISRGKIAHSFLFIFLLVGFFYESGVLQTSISTRW